MFLFRQLSMLIESIILSVLYRFRDPVKILKLEQEKKKISYKKSCEALAQSMGGLEYVKNEMKTYEDKIATIDDKVKRLTTEKDVPEETRKQEAYMLLVEKQQLSSNVLGLQNSVSNSEKNIELAKERIRDLEVDLTESDLKIKALELKRQINDSNNLLITTSVNSKVDNNFKEAEDEINKKGYVLEAKSSLVKQITCLGKGTDAKSKAEEELQGLSFE